MCEIAILDPGEHSVSELTDIAMQIYNHMGTGLGLVGIRQSEDSTEFRYETFKRVTPDDADVLSFMLGLHEDSFRLIIHGRLATHGEASRENTHPLEIGCDECDIDYVLHNGVIGRHTLFVEDHEEADHHYATNVDSEVIAHEFGAVPTSHDDECASARMEFTYQPSYILLNKDSMYIQGNRYILSEDGLMARTRRRFAPNVATDENYDRTIITPTGA